MYGARQRPRRWGIAHVNRLMGFLASRKCPCGWYTVASQHLFCEAQGEPLWKCRGKKQLDCVPGINALPPTAVG